MHSDSRRPSLASEVRLQKYLAACGVGSRRSCEALIAAGAVAVDGRVVTEPGTRIVPGSVPVMVRGRPVSVEGRVALLLNKPPGYLCTSRDPRGRPTFHALLPPTGRRLVSAGRLDGASEGLLLVTNDGDLVNRVTHPRHGLAKVYRVWTTAPLRASDLRALTAGMVVDGVPMRLASIRASGKDARGARYTVTLHEGRNRQIRRMLGARGVGVRRLQRVALGPLRLGRLPPGASRPLTEQEEHALRAAADGAIRAPARRGSP